jgi:hypothetical protein
MKDNIKLDLKEIRRRVWRWLIWLKIEINGGFL